MADFKQARVPRTRGRALVTKATAKPMSRTQTSRTPAEQKEHEASYKRVHAQRTYALAVAAKAALAAHLEEAARPLQPQGRNGQFTSYQLLALEFAEQMDSLLPAEVMAKGPVSINSSCVQRFTARLTKPVGESPSEQAAFRAIADVRRKDEPTISDFVLLRAQLQQSDVRRLEFEGLLSDAKEDLRISSPFCAALKQLPRLASLLEHHRVVSIASRPRMGAPTKAERAAATGSGSLQIATNYESGMHTGAYINKHVAFDNRRFGVAATRTQEDVHQALGLTTSNTPPLSSFRGHQQKRKPIHVAARRTASMWMFQVDSVMNAKFAVAVVECMPFSDEGTREGVGCCVVGMRCMLTGRDSSCADFLGLEFIENKEGRSIGAGMLRVVTAREVAYVWYFWLSDSYGGIVGHRTGAIAYLRVELKQPLAFPIKCMMHIVSRGWKAAVNDLSEGGAAGGCRIRAPIKRKANDAQVSRVVLLTEDIGYLYAKDKTLYKCVVAMQLGNVPITTGCIDTRFESVWQAQRNVIGSTIIGDQMREIFQVSSGRAAADGVADGVSPKRVTVGKLRAVLDSGPNEIGSDGDDPSAHRFRAGSREVWVLEHWSLPSNAAQKLSLVDFHACYRGPRILPQLRVVANYLNPDSLSRSELMELEELPRPASCKVTSLTPQKNLGLLLDIHSRKLRVREVMYENFGWLVGKPFMHFVELRVDGIIFRVHEEIEKHVALVDALRTPEDDQRSTEQALKDIAKLSESVAFGMRVFILYARSLFDERDEDDRYDDDDSYDWFAWQVMGEVAAIYGNYMRDTNQFDDYFYNPAFMLARVNSEKGGPKMARELSELAAGKAGKLHVRLAECLHTTPQLIEQHLAPEADYDGPLRILTDPTLKQQLKDFGAQTLPLSHCPQFDPLRQRLLRHYQMLRVANAAGEEWVKYYKALLPQQIGKGLAWCEVKLRSIIRARIVAEVGEILAPPTLDELRAQRKANGDILQRRFASPPKPPLTLPPELTYDGEESDESGHSEDEEDEAGDEDLSTLTVPRLKELLGAKGLSKAGKKEELITRLQAEDDEADDDEGGGEEDAMQEGEEAPSTLDYRELQQQLKALQQPATGSRDELVRRLEMAREQAADDADEAAEGEGGDGDGDGNGGEQEARVVDPNDQVFLSLTRLVPKEQRSAVLYKGAAVWCFDEDPEKMGEPHPNNTFFALHILEHNNPAKTYIAADTLMYVQEASVYVIDPDFAKSSKEADHRAHKDLIFTVETQQLVEVEGGHNGALAWRIQHRAPAAARARARIDGAAQSDESGHSSAGEMDTY